MDVLPLSTGDEVTISGRVGGRKFYKSMLGMCKLLIGN